MKRILIEARGGVTRTALMDGDRLAALYIDREENGSLVNSVMLGIVRSILPGRFAFVDIGRGRNAFMNLPEGLAVKQGQPLLLQIRKDASGTKGAYAEAELKFNGRLTIVLESPDGEIGVSYKITGKRERERLRKIARKALPPGYGAIMRTNCEGKGEAEIKAEIERLAKAHRSAVECARYARPPAVIYRENTLLYDLLSDDIAEIWADGVYEEITHSVEIASTGFAGKVMRYDAEKEGRGLFDAFNLPFQIERALLKTVPLPCGGFITIEQTEACVVIDVNTGKFIGKKDNNRDTVLQTNLEAADVLADQLMLRNLSGIIIVDFIDMKSPEDRLALTEAVTRAVNRDRVKTEVVGITELGLMQLTRRKTREPLHRLLTETCAQCGGSGLHRKV